MGRTARAWRLAPLVCAARLLVTASAAADDRFVLEWDAPARCPSKAQVDKAVRAWLEAPRVGPAAAEVRVDAKVHRSSDGWELDLTLTAPGGSEHQTLVAERCETLVEVVALKVALAVDPTALLRSLASARTDAEGGADALRFAVRGAIGAGLGPLPDASAFASAAGSVEVPGWRAEIAGSAWLPRSAAYPDLPNVGASFALVTGAVRGCVVPAMGAFDFPLCAGGELGVMRGSGFGGSPNETSSQLWAAAVFGPAVRVPLGSSMSLWLGADAVVGVARPSYFMRNLEELYRPDPVAARAWVGLEVRP